MYTHTYDQRWINLSRTRETDFFMCIYGKPIFYVYLHVYTCVYA